MSDKRESNVLRSACILAALMLVLLGFLVGCTPTPFVTGQVVETPHGCTEARARGHEC